MVFLVSSFTKRYSWCETIISLIPFLFIQMPGYSTEMKMESLAQWEYPSGSEWQKLFAAGTFKPEY